MTFTSEMKRIFDLVGALLGLAVLAPVLALIALLIRVTMGSPVFFSQERTGLQGKSFRILKFRTMVEGEGEDAQRLTRIGRFLRSWSLDEFPQLWNVVRGDMSLVGPRPLLPEYLPHYTPEQARRHEVRPGMTGWSVLQGRNELQWAEQFECDVWYVDHRTLLLDLRILWGTFGKVLARRGVNQPGRATRDRFTQALSRK